MNHNKEQKNEPHAFDAPTGFGMSSDDMSMLNQVLQQVKGISCVSCTETFNTTEQATGE